jgi:group I intron endonuclease
MIIYKIRNLTNNKIYIGRTIKSLAQRKKEHENNTHNHHLHNAFKLYGILNFKWSILSKCKSLDELYDKEIYYIKAYKSNNPKFGYNITGGGEGGLLGYSHKKEYKNLMSKIQQGKNNSNYKHGKYSGRHFCKKCNKELSHFNTAIFCKSCCKIGKKFTAKHRKNISLSKMGKLNPAKKLEVRRKISETVKKRWKEGYYK